MQIKEIKVTAGRTFNHPFESFSNLRPEIELTATINEGEDFAQCTKDLQAKAEHLVEDHKRNMITSLYKLREMAEREREVARLESVIKTSQSALETLRENPIKENLPLPGLAADWHRDEEGDDENV